MSSIHASIASSNLSDIVEFQLHNQKIYNEYIKYQEEFNKIGMDVLKFEKLDQCGYKNIVAKSIDPNLDILKLVSNLNMAGIGARSYYQPPLHRKSHSYPFEIYGSMKITETLGSNMINLPCGWRFKAANVADVFCVIKKQLDGT
jgi:dTDP-4-amino-4,6-dideoxygalactose transaminase